MYDTPQSIGSAAVLRLKLEAAYSQGQMDEVLRLSDQIDKLQMAQFQAESALCSKAV